MADSTSVQAFFPLVCVGYLVFASALTYAAFRRDGREALSGGARVPPATLLALTALGGSLGAKAAEWRLDEAEVRAEPFKAWLNLIVAAQLVCAVALMSAPAGGEVPVPQAVAAAE